MKMTGFLKILTKEINVSPKMKRLLLVIILFFLQLFFWVMNSEGIVRLSNQNGFYTFFLWIKHSGYFWISLFTIITIYLLLVFICNNFFTAYVSMGILTMLIGLINKELYLYRKEFLTLQHFRLFGELRQLNFSLNEVQFNLLPAFLLTAEIIFGIWIFFKSKRNKYRRRTLHFAIIMVCAAGLFLKYEDMSRTDYFYKSHQLISDMDAGSFVCFGESLFESGVAAESGTDIKAIYAMYRNEADNKKPERIPNIIVIMSESFWNFDILQDVMELSDNPYEKFLKIQKKCAAGEIAVNTFGGGTITTEFEFLTGLNAFNTDSKGDFYYNYFAKEQESFVSYLDTLGYETIAVHPFYGEMWHRSQGYANMGFDQFISFPDFQNRETYRGYISDNSMVDEIIRLYEENEHNKPLFCFSVSVANHVLDLVDENEIDEMDSYEEKIKVSFKDDKISEPHYGQIVEYINGMNETILSLEKLINYFEDKEDTVIVFFGDHAPSCVQEVFTRYEMEETALYRTPYLIWNNYGVPIEDYGNMNASYLSSALVDWLAFPKTNQCCLNDYLRKNYPIETKYEILDSEGNDLRNRIQLKMKDEETEHYLQIAKQELCITRWNLKKGKGETDMWIIGE